jgi:3-phosphoshikimate 1-carboxyvinyltransferase
MSLVEAPLAALGSRCETTEGRQPITVLRPLKGGRAEIDARESSQLLTGLLIALPLAPDDSELVVHNAVSKGYLDLTIDTCAGFGVRIERNSDFTRFRIPGSQSYTPSDFTVEGDWSGAAFFVAAAALAGVGKISIHGLSPDSAQPDRAVLDAARAAGLGISWTGGDAPALQLQRMDLVAFDFDATDCPDLFPPLAALATGCRGVTRLRGIHRLRAKESDRAASITAMLAALGTESRLENDSMFIEGRLPEGPDTQHARHLEVDAQGDHRIAMAAAIAALRLDAPVLVKGADCVAKSWPGFFADLESFKIR